MSALFRNISNIKGRDEVFYLLTIRINHPVILFISSCTSFLVLHFCYSYICLVSACWIGGSLKFCFVHFISSVQLLSHVWLFAIPWTVAHHGHFPVHHRLPEFTQTPVCRVSDAIQSCHPLPSPTFHAFNLSQHQGLFQRLIFLHQVAKVLEFQHQHQSF